MQVTAIAETEPVGQKNRDGADDPAIWRDPRNPLDSLIITTDKLEGINVFGLDGKRRQFLPDGRINNVDLVDMGQEGVIVVASDRNDKKQAKLRVYRLDPETRTLALAGIVPESKGEAYGLCLLRSGRELHAFSIRKNGTIYQIKLTLSAGEPTGELVRSMRVSGKSEGCVTDERTQTLYVSDQDRGIWAFDARSNGSIEGKMVAPVDDDFLHDDVEGLAIARVGEDGGWFVASSQGDNAYAVYRLPDFQHAGRFRIAAGAVGSTEHTDGIALATEAFGRLYPSGLFVAQDGKNKPFAQNFKLVSWKDILDAIGADTNFSPSLPNVP